MQKCWLSKIKAKVQAFQTACKLAGGPPLSLSPPRCRLALQSWAWSGLAWVLRGSARLHVRHGQHHTQLCMPGSDRSLPSAASIFSFCCCCCRGDCGPVQGTVTTAGTWPKPCFPRTVTLRSWHALGATQMPAYSVRVLGGPPKPSLAPGSLHSESEPQPYPGRHLQAACATPSTGPVL